MIHKSIVLSVKYILINSKIADPVQAYEKIWIISDEFGYQSYNDHYHRRNKESFSGYMRDHFDMKAQLHGKYVSSDPSIIGRFRNSLVSAIDDDPLLPKMVVVVPDDDLIKALNHKGAGSSKALGRIIEKIMNEREKIISSHKDYIPDKSKREGYPLFVWIEAPLHNNFWNNADRIKFNKCVERQTSFHDSTIALQLKKAWDPSDNNLYVAESRRFSNEGYARYWEAIDKTVKFCDTILLKKPTLEKNKLKKNEQQNNFKMKFKGTKDKYHWRSHSYDQSRRQTNGTERRRKQQRQLPSPPPRRY